MVKKMCKTSCWPSTDGEGFCLVDQNCDLASRIRTSDRWITILILYSPPLYQLSYREMTSFEKLTIINNNNTTHITPL